VAVRRWRCRRMMLAFNTPADQLTGAYYRGEGTRLEDCQPAQVFGPVTGLPSGPAVTPPGVRGRRPGRSPRPLPSCGPPVTDKRTYGLRLEVHRQKSELLAKCRKMSAMPTEVREDVGFTGERPEWLGEGTRTVQHAYIVGTGEVREKLVKASESMGQSGNGCRRWSCSVGTACKPAAGW
jgi:hypothetical protein